MANETVIFGDKGFIKVGSPTHCPTHFEITIFENNKKESYVEPVPEHKGF